MAPACSECGNEIPPYSGRRRFTCSPECSYKRACRHPSRDKTRPPCSECGADCPVRPGKGPHFLTCSEECMQARRRRVYNERVQFKPKHCADCGVELDRQSRSTRCRTCRALNDANKARKSRAKTRATIEAGGQAAKAAEAARRFRLRLNSVYGMTLAEYDAMVDRQDGRCAICNLPPVGRGKTDALVVDHCHNTGRNRELLCGNCNIAIGLLCDDPEVVVRAVEYLRRHRASPPP